MRLIDLTHTFAEPMPVFPGDPPARLRIASSMEVEGTPLYAIATGMHVGTHLDAPLHMFPDGAAIPDTPLEKLFGTGVLIDARGQREIGAELLTGVRIPPKAMVLVLTGFAAHFREPRYFQDYPEITAGFAEALARAEIHLLGLDTPSPDRAPYAVHKLLFRHGILLVENLANLEQLVGISAFEVIALPAKLYAEAAPVRVVARVMGGA
jgi:kynurenine formamidase